MKIRKERSMENRDVRRLNDLVFAGPAEGGIVGVLRGQCPGCLSLVAVEGDRVVGVRFLKPAKADLFGGTVRYRKEFDAAVQCADEQEMER